MEMGPAVVLLVDFLCLKALFQLQILFVDCDRKMIINSVVVRIWNTAVVPYFAIFL